ncbi:hypothetical protein [Cobetia sp. UCD-24C]|uniref:hypothetical protein n=1 Tax=Cobetia sp. UCD-24C TaxID=1716176 RepID=UPI0006CA12B9|nr:hypothetical protein [Cobetia sp. UCD-24C]KPM81856.1 hypothetical protein AOG28_00010 [Cobetia sp. UCD-24C]
MTDTARKHRSAITLAVIVGGLVTLASLTQQNDGARQLSASEAEYCEMTAMWQEDAKAGFVVSQRRGWPDFNGNAASLCSPQITHGQQLASR